ncbi:MAG: cation transporter [Bacteroidetes bacterium]|nr:cation transporter [Bacteroidota bacterium]
MKKVISIILFLTGLNLTSHAQTEVKIRTSAVCSMCKQKLESELAYEKGVKFAKVNLDDKMLTVNYNDKKTSAEKIKIAIIKLGYNADEMKADSIAYWNLPECCRNPNVPHKE